MLWLKTAWGYLEDAARANETDGVANSGVRAL